MSFVTLEDTFEGKPMTQSKREWLMNRYTVSLKNGGVEARGVVTPEGEIILIQEDGETFKTKQFILQRPEVRKFRINDKDFFPPGKSEDSKSK